MATIHTYEEIDRVQWNELMRTGTTATWFQTPEAHAFFASMPELFKPFAIAVEKSESRGLAGVCVGYVTKERSATKQYLTRRAIIIGGPVLADDATNEEVEALMSAVKKQLDEPIYIETRNLNSYEQWKGAFEKAGFRYEPHLNFHVHTDQAWEKNMSSNRKRQIRHAKGLVVSGLAVSEEDIREWYGVLKELYRKKVKTPLWPEEFFLEAYRQGVGTFLTVKHEGKVIGGTMVVKGDERMSGSGGTVYEWFACGKNEEYKEQHPSVMATWEGIQWAKEQGYTRYDMMGAGKPEKEYGVRDFKAEFGGELVEHGRFVRIQHPILYTLGTMGVKVLKMLTTNS